MTLVSFLDKSDKQGQLMLAFAHGDASAFDTLYQYFRQPMYLFFLRQCSNQALAEELYQELWMRVIKAKENYEHNARFSTWLYRIAHNLLTDHFRKNYPESNEANTDDTDELVGAESDEPETQAESGETVHRFIQLLEQLPDEQREVFLLKEEAGLSIEEIAQATKTSFETAKSRLRYAVKKLRQSLEDAA